MKTSLRYLVIFILSMSMSATGQQIINMDDVKIEDFEIYKKANDSLTIEHAVVIFDIGKGYFTGSKKSWFDFVIERHLRVQIIDKSAFDFATIVEELDKYNSEKEKISDIEGKSYNLENGKIEETKFNLKDLVEIEESENYKLVKIALPNIKEGTIFDLKYTITTPFLYTLRPWNFQAEYPTLWSEYKIIIPQFFIYANSFVGLQAFFEKSSTMESALYSVNLAEWSERSDWISIKTKTYVNRWVMKDVPALINEPFIRSLQNYRSRINFQLSEHTKPLNPKTFTNDWDKVSKELKDSKYFMKRLVNSQGVFEDYVSKIGISKTDKLSDLKTIYEYIKKDFIQNSDRDFYLTNNFDKLSTLKIGSMVDINMFLIGSLKYAGFNAQPVVLSSRKNGLLNPYYPLVSEFDQVIALVKLDTLEYLLDASKKYLTFNRLDESSYNGIARSIDLDTKEINLDPDMLLNKETDYLQIINQSDGSMMAIFEIKEGQIGSDRIRRYYKNEKEFKDHLETKYSKTSAVSDINIQNFEDIQNLISYSFKYTLNVATEDSFMYFDPLTMYQYDNPFKSEKRNYSIEFPFLMDESLIVRMEVPTGYKVEELPQSTVVKLNENSNLYFELKISESNGIILYKGKLKSTSTFYSTEDYISIKKFFDHIASKYGEQIVFKKI